MQIGNPGSGKTVLAASVLEWLESHDDTKNGNVAIGFYFFSYRSLGTRSPISACASILSQILHQFRHCQHILELYSFAHSHSKQNRIHAEGKDLFHLLNILACQLPNLVVVLDGLDECDDADTLIWDIASSFRDTNAKLIVFSRPSVQGLIVESSLKRISLTREEVRQDIRTYLSRRLNETTRRRLLPHDEDAEELLSYLLQGANGMFLWARLMMDYIQSPALDRLSRSTAIRSVTRHDSIDQMYVRILRLISNKIEPEKEMARRVFNWLTCSVTSLSDRQLWEVTRHWRTPSKPPGLLVSRIPSDDELQEFSEAVVVVCASVVENSEDCFRFTHKSVVEFLTNPPDSTEAFDPKIAQFWCRPAETHDNLVGECLTYLTCRIPAKPLSGDMKHGTTSQHVNKTLPFLRYASVYWTEHLYMSLHVHGESVARIDPSIKPTQTCKIIEDFLSNKLVVMVWIEAQYLLAHRGYTERVRCHLKKWVDKTELGVHKDVFVPEDIRSLRPKLHSLHGDLEEIHGDWAQTLKCNAYQVWNDVPAFTNGSLLMQTSAVSVSSLATSAFGDSNLSRKPLMSVSKESSCGNLLGVLSIWPIRCVPVG